MTKNKNRKLISGSRGTALLIPTRTRKRTSTCSPSPVWARLGLPSSKFSIVWQEPSRSPCCGQIWCRRGLKHIILVLSKFNRLIFFVYFQSFIDLNCWNVKEIFETKLKSTWKSNSDIFLDKLFVEISYHYRVIRVKLG